MTPYELGQKAAGSGQTNIPPKDLPPRQAEQFRLGHKDGQAKNAKKS